MSKPRKIGWYLLGMVAICALAVGQEGAAQSYRSTLRKPTVEVFQSMLRATTQQDYDGLKKSLTLLDPILVEVNRKFQVDLAAEFLKAISEGRHAAVAATVRKLIFYDMKDLFALLTQERGLTEAQMQAFLKSAYLDYQLLAPTVTAQSVETNARIQRWFKEAAEEFSIDPSPFSREKGVDRQRVQRTTQRIEAACAAALPGLSHP